MGSALGPVLGRLTVTACARRGEHRRGNPRYAKYRQDIWAGVFPWTEEQHVPDLIDAAVSHLEGRKEALRAFTEAPGGLPKSM
jgi:hypothetical protein